MLAIKFTPQEQSKYQKERFRKLVAPFNKRREGDSVYISLDDYAKVESDLMYKSRMYGAVDVDCFDIDTGKLIRGGLIGTDDYRALVRKLPREDLYYTQGGLKA